MIDVKKTAACAVGLGGLVLGATAVANSLNSKAQKQEEDSALDRLYLNSTGVCGNFETLSRPQEPKNGKN